MSVTTPSNKDAFIKEYERICRHYNLIVTPYYDTEVEVQTPEEADISIDSHICTLKDEERW